MDDEEKPEGCDDSESHSAPEDLTWVESLIAGSENIRFATMVPRHLPTVWAIAYRARSLVVIAPKSRSSSVTAGLKWAPETVAKMRKGLRARRLLVRRFRVVVDRGRSTGWRP